MAGTDQCYMHLMYLGNIDVASAQSTLTMVVLQVICPISVSHYLSLVFSSTVYPALMCSLG